MYSCGYFYTKWFLSGHAVALHGCLWTGSPWQVLAPEARLFIGRKCFAHVYLSWWAGNVPVCTLHCGTWLCIVHSHFESSLLFLKIEKMGRQQWEILRMLGQFMIRLRGPFLTGHYELVCFYYSSSGDFGLQNSYQVWILTIPNLVGWGIHKNNPSFNVFYIHNLEGVEWVGWVSKDRFQILVLHMVFCLNKWSINITMARSDFISREMMNFTFWGEWKNSSIFSSLSFSWLQSTTCRRCKMFWNAYCKK